MRNHQVKRVGITGGIGCGKTTVVAAFRQLGVDCFVADEVAAAYYRDPAFLGQLRALFGDEIFTPDGKADKRRLADLVFADADALSRLNSLVHPRVMADFEAFCLQHQAAPYVLFESAILYESGIFRQMDKVICVYLSLAERMQRLRERDHTTDQHIAARIAAQLPAEQVMDRADYVVLNYEGNPRARQVAYIDKILKQ
ncbi:MAG: dephospho-CoA kinase [Bacteroidales bacterium]|nr:dephospho-CoA kinase [Bacteroidales bacterium]